MIAQDAPVGLRWGQITDGRTRLPCRPPRVMDGCMVQIRTVVADDDRDARARLTGLLQREPAIELVGEASDGREAVRLVAQTSPSLMFLDVHMPYLDGFAVLEATAPAHMPATVFVTAHDRYAIRAFEAQALDYLVKPYTDDRFAAALARACRLVPARAADRVRPPSLDRLVIKTGGRILLLDVHDIDWIEACGVYVSLHVGGRVHVYRSSIAQLVARLDPARFVRVHRSAAVNTARIRELQARSHGDYTVVLKDGTQVVMSRGYRACFEHWLGQQL